MDPQDHIKELMKQKTLQDYYNAQVPLRGQSGGLTRGAEVTSIARQEDNSIIATVRVFEDAINDSAAFRVTLREALQETIRAIASTILNERKAEIEAACNFEDLRDVLAAELARQFMASRLTGQPTPLDKPAYLPAGYTSGGTVTTTGNIAQVAGNIVKVQP